MALGKGLHRITRCDDKEEVSMTSDERYDELAERNHEPGTLVEFFRESPFVGVELELERQKDEGREIEL